MKPLRIVWWLDPRPTLTLEWLTDDALNRLIKTCSNVVQYLDSDDGKPLPAPVQGWVDRKLAMCVYGSLACHEYRVNRCGGKTWFWQFAGHGKELARRGATFEMPAWHDDVHIIQSHWSTGMRRKAIDPNVKVPWGHVDEYWPTLWPVPTSNGGYELRVNRDDKAALAIDDLWLPDEIRNRVVNL